MNTQELFDLLKAEFGDAVLEAKPDAVVDPYIVLAPARLAGICKFLRDDGRLLFDYMMCQSGVDYNNGTLGSIYHLSSMKLGHKVILRVVVSKDDPTVPSVTPVWGAANWMERETYDLLGIVYQGHPDLRRILLPYDWEGYPLRKDYKVPEFYNGMKIPY